MPADVVSAYVGDLVTSVGAHAFLDKTSLSAIEIPDSVQSFGSSSFENCSALTSICIPDGVQAIYGSTFKNCGSLISVRLPNSVIAMQPSVFYGCSSLSAIDIPSALLAIEDGVFAKCTSLSDLNIPAAVSSISPRAFSYCTTLTAFQISQENQNYQVQDGLLLSGQKLVCGINGAVAIPNSTTKIGDYAFHGRSNLSSLSVHADVGMIGAYAFADCDIQRVYIDSISAWCAIGMANADSNPGYHADEIYM